MKGITASTLAAMLISLGLGPTNAAQLTPPAPATVFTDDATRVGAWHAVSGRSTFRGVVASAPLPDGRILYAGGFHGSQVHATAEVFDPNTETWQSVGRMRFPRYGASTAVLHDGRVLVVGGDGQGASANGLRAVELFDPATNTWAEAGALEAGRREPELTVLFDGRVLATGGAGSQIAPGRGPITLASSELFDPVTLTWRSTGSMSMPRERHSATLLPDGRVLIVGGWYRQAEGPSPILADSAEIFDPETESWSAAAPLQPARVSHGAALLSSGRVLVVGGFTESSEGAFPRELANDPLARVMSGLAAAHIYDPLTDTWSAVEPMRVGRGNPMLGQLPDGRVLVAGPESGLYGGKLATPELYDEEVGRWRLTGEVSSVVGDETITVSTTGIVLTKFHDGQSSGEPSDYVFNP